MGMSLEDAITHAEKIAKIEEQACFLISNEDGDYDNHKKCGEQHRQLAEWLKDYKRLKEQEPVFDRIRAEIEQAADKQFQIAMGIADLNERYTHIQMENAYRHSLNVIDKYKAESEERNEGNS